MRLARRLLQVLMIVSLAVIAPLATNVAPAAAADAFNDIASSKFRADINWLANQNITSGCGNGKFCPDGVVTRSQMASFLVRMFDLPATNTDFFSDDDDNKHESNINRLAASGITSGCGGDRFCPEGVVTRAQMATFLTRALNLSYGAGNDWFTDDDNVSHETNIDRFYFAGVTSGCGGSSSGTFCPNGSVTRGQMAAFLHRASDIDYRATPGINSLSTIDRTISFSPGTYTGVTFNPSGTTATHQTKAVILSDASAHASKTQVVSGVRYVFITNGTFANLWVKSNSGATQAVGIPLEQVTSQSLWHGTTAHQQQTSIWCVPASTKTMLEMMGLATSSSQSSIYNYGRANMGYTITLPGLDPQAWARSLNHFGGSAVSYVDATYSSFDAAIKQAVRDMRMTGRPIGITINGGTHAWVLTGWKATADPMYTNNFSVTSVQVVAPFMAWTDPAPGSWFSYSYMKGKMTPYYEAERWTRWNGTYVLVRPKM